MLTMHFLAQHIFMKCHFSSCGDYLHIVALEGATNYSYSWSRRVALQDFTKLHIVVFTYRLSSQNPTGCRPALIHRVRVPLASEESFSASRLPFVLTWTPDEVYISRSSDTLSVHRVRLFKDPDIESERINHDVLLPYNTVLLPRTAKWRRVYYIPPDERSGLAQVIVGHQTREGREMENDDSMHAPTEQHGHQDGLCPPVGCYLDEQKDIGGWGRIINRPPIPMDQGIGKLRHKENGDDGCEFHFQSSGTLPKLITFS